MSTLALAALSARLMAEAAAADGFEVVALDLFGDLDTRAAAARWQGIGEAAALQIDGPRLLAALLDSKREGAAGWVAGSGFEGRCDLLAEGAALLHLVGSAPDQVARLRDPACFFAFLDEHAIGHPPVQLAPAGEGAGWLLKDFHGCGGGHIRRLAKGAPAALAPGQYLQREMPGEPMSATFVANGRDACLLGVNRQIVGACGERPYVFRGVLGPLPVADGLRQRLQRILRALTRGFELRGLASLDFLLDEGQVRVLEVNPRPPASLALYADARPMAAHVRACLHGELPQPAPAAGPVQGHEIVFARRPLQLGPALARRLASWPGAHDLPGAGQRFAAGDPLCSVAARGASAAEVLGRLRQRREALLQSMETVS